MPVENDFIDIDGVQLPKKIRCLDENSGPEAVLDWYEPNDEALQTEAGQIAQKLVAIAESGAFTTDFDNVVSVESILAQSNLRDGILTILESREADPNLIRVLNDGFENDKHPKFHIVEALRAAADSFGHDDIVFFDGFLEIVEEIHSSYDPNSDVGKAVERFLVTILINEFYFEKQQCNMLSEVEKAIEAIQDTASGFSKENQARLEQELESILEESPLEDDSGDF